MGQPIAFVTGAGGEMGHLLLPALRDLGYGVVALDLNPLPPDIAATCLEAAQADILDGERELQK